MDDFDEANPFADPSIRQARPVEAMNQPNIQPIDTFNPFEDKENVSQPAVMTTTSIDTSVVKNLQTTTDDLKKQQEELDRRAAELDKREQELRRSMNQNVRIKNFPPLPSWFCLKPCFFQDINLEIPLEFQLIVTNHFKLWIAYLIILGINILGSLCYLAINGREAGSTFGLSILFLLIFSPLSYIGWFRPLYNAFRNDSSFNFFLYFFVFFMQFCVNIVQCFGISGSGTVGFISSFSSFNSNVAVGIVLLLVGLLFILLAAFNLHMLLKVHRIYRSSGASFAKAQEEFARGIFSSSAVRNTAANVVSGTTTRSYMS